MTKSSLCENELMDELNKHKESIASAPLFSELSADQLRDVVSICKLKNCSKHDILFNEGDLYLGFYILLEGSVKVFKTTSEGSETVVHIIKPLTAFADIPLFEGIDYPVSAQCLEDCLVIFIPKEEFLKLIKENPEISLKMLSGFAKRLKSLVSQIEDLSTKEVVNRLAKYLIKEIKLKKNENIPNPFIVACDKFIYIEILKNQPEESETEFTESKPSLKPDIDKITPKVIKLISSTITDLADDDGWAFLGDVGNLLQKKQPNFDSRNYGFQKLTPLIKSTNKFEIEQRESSKGRFKLIYVKNK